MASVQFNLLPNVKLEYIKTQRSKNLIITIAALVAGAAVAIFLIMLLTVEGVQKKQLNDANGAITDATNKLKNTPGLNQIVTVQNQLQTLTGLQRDKHLTSRLFGYLSQVTPTNVNVGNLSLDLTANSLQVTGTAPSQGAVNTYIDTLKFTTFKVGDQGDALPAFSSVVENSFSLSASAVNYSLNVQLDPQLFSNSTDSIPKLTVPKLTTTRSVTEDPNNTLFNGQGSTTTTKTGAGQ